MKAINIGIVGGALLLNAAFMIWHFELLPEWGAGPERHELLMLVAEGQVEEARLQAAAHFEAMQAAHGLAAKESLEAGQLLATVLQRSDDYEGAVALYERMRTVLPEASGVSPAKKSAFLSGMISLYMERKQVEQAIEVAKEKLALREEHLGPGHLLIISDLLVLTDLYRHHGAYKDARTALERCKVIIAGDPGNMRLRNHLHFSLLQLEQEENAAAEAAEQGAPAPSTPDTLFTEPIVFVVRTI